MASKIFGGRIGGLLVTVGAGAPVPFEEVGIEPADSCVDNGSEVSTVVVVLASFDILSVGCAGSLWLDGDGGGTDIDAVAVVVVGKEAIPVSINVGDLRGSADSMMKLVEPIWGVFF